jgi:hypothetical protein
MTYFKMLYMSKKKNYLSPTKSELSQSTEVNAPQSKGLVFGKEQYQYMLLGLLFVVLGLIFMAGGAMPDEDTWDPSLIYSWRRITLAPLLILIGLGIEIYAIFKK